MAITNISCVVCGCSCIARSAKRRFCSDKCRMRLKRSEQRTPAYVANMMNMKHNQSK